MFPGVFSRGASRLGGGGPHLAGSAWFHNCPQSGSMKSKLRARIGGHPGGWLHEAPFGTLDSPVFGCCHRWRRSRRAPGLGGPCRRTGLDPAACSSGGRGNRSGGGLCGNFGRPPGRLDGPVLAGGILRRRPGNWPGGGSPGGTHGASGVSSLGVVGGPSGGLVGRWGGCAVGDLGGSLAHVDRLGVVPVVCDPAAASGLEELRFRADQRWRGAESAPGDPGHRPVPPARA